MRVANAYACDRIYLSLSDHRRRFRGARQIAGASLPTRPPRLVTARLVLDPLEGHHANALFAVLDDPEIYRYESGDPYLDVASLRARYERTTRGPSDPRERWWNWAIVSKVSPAPSAIGTVEISLVDAGARALLGYTIGRAYWGAGYAFEAASAAIAYVHETAEYATIDAYIDVRNARSLALARRLGLQRIAFLPENDTIAGVLTDDYHYRLALTKDGEP